MGKRIAQNGVKKLNGGSNIQNTANGIDSHRNGTQNSEIEELTERLRRLEDSRSHRNTGSDVYKFMLFFIMGVVMTVFLYPHAAKTIQSISTRQQSLEYDIKQDKSRSEEFVDVDDKHTATDPVSINIINRTLVHGDSEYRKDESVRDIVNEKLLRETKISQESNEHIALETGRETTIDKIQEPLIGENLIEDNDENNKVRSGERVELFRMDGDEDPLIGEDLIEDNDENNKVRGGERVELFRMDRDEGVLPVTFVDVEEKEMTLTDETTSKESGKKLASAKKISKKGSEDKKTSKKKQKKTSNNVKQENPSNRASVGSSKLPDEIKNFKPTYQKYTTPKKIFVDGRRIPPMELLPQKPNNSSVKVWMFEEFLSEAECDGLMRVHKQHVENQSKLGPILCFDSIGTLRKHLENVGKSYVKVSPKDFTEGTTCVNATFSTKLKTWLKGNWSYSTAFYPGESRFASIFEDRVQQAMGLKPENGGKFQITSYPLGIGYKSHTDCTESTDKRDRVATVLVYLDTVNEGGETDFPELGIWVRPRKARALLWNNMNEAGDCEPLSIHQAKKVVKGHKVILQRWYYYQSFYSLGKRPPEPPLPKRASGQPRVSCDEYEYGSCRWYDEWNFEHMLEYERQKYNLI